MHCIDNIRHILRVRSFCKRPNLHRLSSGRVHAFLYTCVDAASAGMTFALPW